MDRELFKEDVAALLGIKVGTVINRASRTRRKPADERDEYDFPLPVRSVSRPRQTPGNLGPTNVHEPVWLESQIWALKTAGRRPQPPRSLDRPRDEETGRFLTARAVRRYGPALDELARQ